MNANFANDSEFSLLELAADAVIGCEFDVLNRFGTGFVEKVHENALAYEDREHGVTFRQQHGFSVICKNIIVGQTISDLLVEDQ
jgi:GxxExxY protein